MDVKIPDSFARYINVENNELSKESLLMLLVPSLAKGVLDNHKAGNLLNLKTGIVNEMLNQNNVEYDSSTPTVQSVKEELETVKSLNI